MDNWLLVQKHPEVLKISDTSITAASNLFAKYGLEVAFLVPTANGLKKGIMDAPWPMREYFKRTGLHDYAAQNQGKSGKRSVSATLLKEGGESERTVSLYRPTTKEGDPRIWVYGLPDFASAGNLLAFIVESRRLYIVNCSHPGLEGMLLDPRTTLGGIVSRLDVYAPIARELLIKLREISKRGFIPSMRSGDTGIGFTLESLLGIKANSNRAPDYHGIEIKSGRMGKKNAAAYRDKITLFSQIPDWTISPFTARMALESFGYRDEHSKRLQLYCSIDARRGNSLGFILQARGDSELLANVNRKRVPEGEDVFLWGLERLRAAFSAKHRETFWVGAKTRIGENRVEHFHYLEARHTRRPTLATFDRLLEQGGICLDLTLSEKPKGKSVRDHGYLFRLYGPHFEDLFPQANVYNLGA